MYCWFVSTPFFYTKLSKIIALILKIFYLPRFVEKEQVFKTFKTKKLLGNERKQTEVDVQKFICSWLIEFKGFIHTHTSHIHIIPVPHKKIQLGSHIILPQKKDWNKKLPYY